MTEYRKKPIIINAVKFEGGMQSIQNIVETLCISNKSYNFESGADGAFYIHTLEGTHKADVGDWIIKGVAGEFYPCKPEIFEQTYERVHPIRHCMVCPSTDDVKRYKTKHNGSFCPNGGDGYVQYCKNHANQHGYTDEDLHSTHR